MTTASWAETQAFFGGLPLVYLPNESAWVPLTSCVWTAPAALRSVKALAGTFPTLNKLFTKVLNVRDAGPDRITKELVHLSGDLSQSVTIKSLLLDIIIGIQTCLK